MASNARRAFDENSRDIRRLLELWSEFEGLAKEAPRQDDEKELPATRIVCLKSVVVLLVSHWEAYVEDIAEEALRFIVKHVGQPDALPKELRKSITKELQAEKDELAVWKLCGKNWRVLCLERFDALTEKRNRNFNSPKSHLVDLFVQETIGLRDVTSTWESDDLDSAGCRARLDKIIELRGAIAHRGKVTRDLTLKSVDSDIRFVQKLVARTGGSINTFVKRTTGSSLWATDLK